MIRAREQAFKTFSYWLHVFSLDLEYYFSLQLPYAQQLKFAVVMSIPLICFLIYGLLANLDKNAWVDR
jgi:hypothetical protein